MKSHAPKYLANTGFFLWGWVNKKLNMEIYPYISLPPHEQGLGKKLTQETNYSSVLTDVFHVPMEMYWGKKQANKKQSPRFVSLQWNSPPSEWAIAEAITKEIHDLITNQTKMPWILKRASDKRHLQLTPAPGYEEL